VAHELIGWLSDLFAEQARQVTHTHARVRREDCGAEVTIGVGHDVIEYAAHQAVLWSWRGGEQTHLGLIAGSLEVGDHAESDPSR
jgi:hypothetical protein